METKRHWQKEPGEILSQGPVVPVMVIHKLEQAVPLAKALMAGGIRVIEITLRTPVAMEAIRAISRDVPGALVGAGTVPAAIHVTPESLCGGMLAKVQDGDLIRLDVGAGRLELLVDDDVLRAREFADPGVRKVRYGVGRQIFAPLRGNMMSPEEGASSLFTYVHEKCQVNIPFKEE